MTTLHFEDAPVSFTNFEGRQNRWFPAGKRYFHVKLFADEANRLDAEGWRVRKMYGEYYLLVHIDEEYDTPVAHLDKLNFHTAEIFIEGRDYNLRELEGISARLISITPKQ